MQSMTEKTELKDYEVRPYPIRVPVALKRKIEIEAKQNNRSYHAEIINRLEASFPSDAPCSDSDIAKITKEMQKLTKQLNEYIKKTNSSD